MKVVKSFTSVLAFFGFVLSSCGVSIVDPFTNSLTVIDPFTSATSSSSSSETESSTSIPEPPTEWPEVYQSLMKDYLYGTVLPFIEGGWRWELDDKSVVGLSNDTTVEQVLDVYNASSSEWEYLGETNSSYCYKHTVDELSKVYVYISMSDNPYSLSEIRANGEIELPEGQWPNYVQQLMKDKLEIILPFAFGTWQWTSDDAYVYGVSDDYDAYYTRTIFYYSKGWRLYDIIEESFIFSYSMNTKVVYAEVNEPSSGSSAVKAWLEIKSELIYSQLIY